MSTLEIIGFNEISGHKFPIYQSKPSHAIQLSDGELVAVDASMFRLFEAIINSIGDINNRLGYPETKP